MHERRFHGEIERLRAPERIARLELDRIADETLAGIEPFTLLDVGTGTGIFAELFTGRGLCVSGIDASPEMIRHAQKIVAHATFRTGTAEDLPFSDKSFDVVFLGLLIHEADDPMLALREAVRVARLRVMVLEWPYRTEDEGPPIQDRLKPEQIEEYFRLAGLPGVRKIQMKQLDLYSGNPV
jgi:ubiquinone/menaquinone biosynthesis C-methylase UbiE